VSAILVAPIYAGCNILKDRNFNAFENSPQPLRLPPPSDFMGSSLIKGWMTRQIFFGLSESVCFRTYLRRIKDSSMKSIMIAQWDSSLSVLPVARVMTAQWNSSLSVLPVTRVMIAQWDSSLSVLPVVRD